MNDISIYICTYDEDENIQDCINSIKGNGYKNIFVIDASINDSTKKKAEEIGVKVIKAPKGLAGQRQIAIDLCKSKYLMFVDADDRLHKNCIDTLIEELKFNKYDAIQASIRSLNPQSYWQKAHDTNNVYCINIIGKTKVIGRPAVYKSKLLKKVGMDISFNGIGNEDSALSIRIDSYGAVQGIGSGLSYRLHPKTFKENFIAWRKYGLGDAQLIKKHKNKLIAIVSHLLITYPIKRSWIYIKNFRSQYILFPILMGLVRSIYLLKGIFLRK